MAEEVEGAVEAVLARLLRATEQPRNVIDACIAAARDGAQATTRRTTLPREALGAVRGVAEMKIECARVREGARAHGRSAVDLRLRSETGALMVGLRRGDRLMASPDPAAPFEAGDVVYLAGTREATGRALPYFDPALDGAQVPVLP
ncbi:MAG: TrkA C-terminal domain-containing protein [Polyangiales bacterium]